MKEESVANNQPVFATLRRGKQGIANEPAGGAGVPRPEAAYQPDELDWKIIHILTEEDATNSSVARRLGIAEGTVRSRLKRLRTHGIIRVRALINPEVIADQQLALLAITVSESHLLDGKARELAALDRVLNVSIVSGQYDLMVEVLVDSNHGLVHFLTEELSAISGIQKTETFLTLRSYNKYV